MDKEKVEATKLEARIASLEKESKLAKAARTKAQKQGILSKRGEVLVGGFSLDKLKNVFWSTFCWGVVVEDWDFVVNSFVVNNIAVVYFLRREQNAVARLLYNKISTKTLSIYRPTITLDPTFFHNTSPKLPMNPQNTPGGEKKTKHNRDGSWSETPSQSTTSNFSLIKGAVHQDWHSNIASML